MIHSMDVIATPLSKILLSTLVVSLIGLTGGVLLLLKEDLTRRWSSLLISFSAGAILSATFFDLFPGALEHPNANINTILTAALLGIIVFFALERLLIWHHHAHEDESHRHTNIFNSPLSQVRPLIIIGDTLHNMLDGAIIAIAFITDTRLGIITSLAVLAHEIPQEIGDFSILLSSGLSRKRVLFWNAFSALAALVGAIGLYLARQQFEYIELPILGFVIGNFIYIALADLLPTIQHERKVRSPIFHISLIVIGAWIIWFIGKIIPEG